LDKSKEISRGNAAKRILEDELYVEAFATVREALIQRMVDTDPMETDEVMKAHLLISSLDLIDGYIRSVMHTGQMAEMDN